MKDEKNSFLSLKQFDQEPVYQIKVKSTYNYEVLVNDVPVLVKYNDYMNDNFTEINSAILSAGTQQVAVKIFPKSRPDGTLLSKLEKDIPFRLSVERTEWTKAGDLAEPEALVSYELPQARGGAQIDYSTLSEFMDTLSFTASVPYTLNGWQQSVDLRKMNREKLEADVVSFYKKLKDAFETGDLDFYKKAIAPAELLVYQASYFTKDEALAKSSTWYRFVEEKHGLEPLEPYTLQIFGSGRLVCLRGVNAPNKGEGVLRYLYKKNGMNRMLTYDLLLHQPAAGGDFEVIWFKHYDKNFFKGMAR
ncbi:hypothetical protein [Niabella hirudinis]|uniref:hypothetical protein n=1 Tax=Niabella hirudinis TaxID=1285929 RepID=UPI003EBA5C88